MEIRRYITKKGPKAAGPYSTAVEASGTVYLSGLSGVDPAAGKLKEGGILPQTAQMLENFNTVLSELGLSFGHVVKSTIFLTDLNDLPSVRYLYGEAFGQDLPACSCVQVPKLPMGAAIELECVAVR